MSSLSVIIAAMYASASAAYAQPRQCIDSNQCANGYCVKSAGVCHPCLQCQDYKRETSYKPCAKSVQDCGPCLQGFTDERSGEVIGECLPPGAEGSLPAYIICIIASLCILILLGLFGAIYVYWKKNTIGNTVISAVRACLPQGSRAQAPSAPEAPPPYAEAGYTSVRPESPSVYYPYPPQPQPVQEEASSPLVKRGPVEAPESAPRVGAAREAASGYHPPAWVRLPNPVDDENGNPVRQPSPDVDENTAPHPWTPYGAGGDSNDINGNTSADETAPAPQEPVSGSETVSSLPALLEQARSTTLVVPPPKKIKRSVSNSNGNTTRGREPLSASERGDGAVCPPSQNIILNIQVNQHANS